ncbi:uncharacterized protein LOC118438952 [Folsomia candida]|uniref:uncharacterized protein LOC118438952 n=1 Tax=Folsomia candida TaxID=158441 RepID=UPI0016053211|nr:uncharacterized protein LOC118438952 [Folsomia candida]
MKISDEEYVPETRRKIIFFKRQRRKRREPSRGSSKTPGDESEYTSNGSDYDVKTSSLSDEDILIEIIRSKTMKRMTVKRPRRDHEPSRVRMEAEIVSLNDQENATVDKSNSSSEIHTSVDDQENNSQEQAHHDNDQESVDENVDILSYCLSHFAPGHQPLLERKRLVAKHLLYISKFLESQLEEKTKRLNEYMQTPSTLRNRMTGHLHLSNIQPLQMC